MRISTVAVFVLAACGAANRPDTPAAPPNRCNDVVTAAVDRVYAASGAASSKDNLEAIKAIKVRRCLADAWPDAALDCAAHAATIPELRDCRAKLATDQAAALAAQESQVRDDWEQELAAAKALRDKMCACPDRACALELDKQVAVAVRSTEPHRHASVGTPPPRDVAERVDADLHDLRECQHRLHGSAMDDALDKMDYFAGEMCQCKDTACAQRVSDEMMKWGQDNARSMDREFKPNEDETKRMAQITQRMTDCMTKAMGVGTPGP